MCFQRVFSQCWIEILRPGLPQQHFPCKPQTSQSLPASNTWWSTKSSRSTVGLESVFQPFLSTEELYGQIQSEDLQTRIKGHPGLSSASVCTLQGPAPSSPLLCYVSDLPWQQLLQVSLELSFSTGLLLKLQTMTFSRTACSYGSCCPPDRAAGSQCWQLPAEPAVRAEQVISRPTHPLGPFAKLNSYTGSART